MIIAHKARRTLLHVERYLGVALGLGFCRCRPDDAYHWALTLNLPFVTASFYWKPAALTAQGRRRVDA